MITRAPTAVRRLLRATGTAAVPRVHDPVTARMVEQAGFPAVYLGGNGLGINLAKCQPLLTLTETAHAAARITRTTELPLIVDAGSGVGSVLHVRRTVVEIADLRSAAEKIGVAARARRDADFCIIARTDAWRATHSIDELLRRCEAYVAFGAEALLLLDVERAEHLDRVRQAVPGVPLLWMGGVMPPVLSMDELTAAGFRLALYPCNAIAAITQAVANLWKSVRETGRVPQSDKLLLRMRGELSVLAGLKTYCYLDDEPARRRPPYT